MFYYTLYGTKLISDVAFPQLVKVSSFDPDAVPHITIKEGKLPAKYLFDRNCYSDFLQNESYLSNSFCYLYVENGNSITYQRKNNASDAVLNPYILGWGIAMLFHQRGMLAIHCSCVANEKGAMLISGYSGSGKSTTTAYLLENGYRLMADDIAMLDISDKNHIMAYPAFPYQKLCRDAAERHKLSLDDMIYIDETKDKFLVPYEGSFSLEPERVRSIVVLSARNTSQVLSEELSGIEKWYACLDALFLGPLLGDRVHSAEYGKPCLDLASACPVYKITRPYASDTRKEIFNVIQSIIR